MKKIALVLLMMLTCSMARADAVTDHKQAVDMLMNGGINGNSNQEFKKAYEIAERLNSQGHCGGAHILGIIYLNGYGVSKDANKAKDMLFRSANAGCAAAASLIGFIYTSRYSLLGPVDESDGLNWLSKSYELYLKENDTRLACKDARLLAEIYFDKKQYSDSLSWYQKGQKTGNSDCTDSKSLARISELEKSAAQQNEAMREDPPVLGITLSLGGASSDEAKPKRKSKKK